MPDNQKSLSAREKVSSMILSNISDYQQKSISITPHYSFSQYQTIQEAVSYFFSHFVKIAKNDSTLFFNIVRPRCKITSKQIDIDTKDITILSENPSSPVANFKAFILEKELKYWMKKQVFGSILNDIVRETPVYGSSVVKKTKGNIQMVNMLNFFNEQAAPSLDKAFYRGEIHFLSPGELASMPWDGKDVLLNKADNDSLIIAIEWYGKINKKDVMAVVGNITKEKRGERNYSVISELKPNIIHIEEGIKPENVYQEFHLDRHNVGRWLAQGIPEMIRDDQIAQNDAINSLMGGLKWLAKRYFQTRDEDLKGKNIMEDVPDGSIFYTKKGEITPIATEERNLAMFTEWTNIWRLHSDEESFTQDPLRGATPPSGTPLGSSILAARQAGGYHEFTREQIGISIKQMFKNWIIPEFKKQKRQDHYFRLMGSEDDLEMIDKARESLLFRKEILSFIGQKGYIPFKVQGDIMRQSLRERLRQGKDRNLFIPQGFYDDFDYDVDITITGEEIDISQKLQSAQMALQIISANPLVLRDKNSRKLFFKLMDAVGISPSEFVFEEETSPMPIQQGGSVAKPQVSQLQTIQTQNQF